MKKSEIEGFLLEGNKYKYTVEFTNQFKKDTVNIIRRGFDVELLRQTIKLLATDGNLPAKYKAHKLEGNFKGLWECHVKDDWLLVWQQTDTNFTLMLTNTGTHASIFGM